MKVWESYIRKVEPYVPGEQPKIKNVIKLNTNENPYPPSKAVMDALTKLDLDSLKLYPDPEVTKLNEAIANFYGVSKNQVFTGVGSDDVISMIFMTFFNSDKPVLFPEISYSFYSVWADLHKVPYETVRLDEDFNILVEDFNRENGGIIFPNPNAPTSKYLELSSVEEIIKNNQDSVVVVDEAYIDFGGESAIKFVNKYDNLIVVQTFSKSRSMAGMRIGYAIANEKLIKALNDVKFSFNSYTMNRTAIELGTAAINDKAYFEECCKKIVATRERTMKALKELGFSFPESKANFIFAKHENVPASLIFTKLKEKNIFVRYFNKPRIDNYLRITIGTDEQMDALIKALKEIL
ncbi:MAG: histidinol-phosphate transaminase [Lachnospira sp.]|uniref:Histidinol-phosphate aminotransferase n=1 Tax=Lachnospira pectinoschiza TaxID=28052 RepID=A0A1G9YEH6_9FIRM|nr:histidinol-phosphate transaminase [Lachnospira pectinoschiza]MCR5516801.1 histidinol-phosphate transaminase [Lachnospira sp.]SDN07467.1 histidinol-phosphate aminotransferase [Lachnospira pectinoschiza]